MLYFKWHIVNNINVAIWPLAWVGSWVGWVLEVLLPRWQLIWKYFALQIELFSWKTTSHNDHLEICQPIRRLLSGLYGMWSSIKITHPFVETHWEKMLEFLYVVILIETLYDEWPQNIVMWCDVSQKFHGFQNTPAPWVLDLSEPSWRRSIFFKFYF